MGNKTPTQLSFEQKLKDMNVLLPAEAFAIDDTGTYISDETALFCDIYIAGRDDGYNECMQDNDASINSN